MAAGGSGTIMDDSLDSSTEEEYWRGCAMDEIYRGLGPFELEHVPPVRPSDAHAVLHHYPVGEAEAVAPRPYRAHHKWDAQHVRMPCSSKSQYPVTAEDGKSTIESRWQMIEKALRQPITNSREFQAAVLSYNSKYEKYWDFFGLHVLFEKELDESEVAVFFEDLLPRIIRLALRLPELVQAPIPLLRQDQNHSVTLTQEQIACLLANAFLCTFPRRNTLKKGSEYSNFSDINFNRLYQTHNRHTLEKIKCICHYFRRVCPTARGSTNVPTGVVTFTRRSLTSAELPRWADCDAPLGITPLHITAAGTIEDQGIGLLQVDFANKFLGGGVLREGCVQEEIRFVICPELLISKLFIEYMRPTEAVVIVGCERYSNYTGYANSFQWAGNYEDTTPRDSSRRRMTHVVAIDALHFVQTPLQYREEFMLRELNKAYAGFLHPLVTPAPGVASGNWGCGAFGGNALLKALLQLMVCTVTKRPLVYYTFGNGELRDEVHRMHTFFIEHNVRVKDLWMALTRFESQQLAPKELYNFLYSCLGSEQKYSPRHRKTPAQTKSVTSEHFAGATGPTTDTMRALTASGKQKSSPNSQPQRKNDSLDIFASSSESEHDTEAANLSVSEASPRSKKQPPSTAATSRSNTTTTVDLCTPDSGSCSAPSSLNAHNAAAEIKEQQQSAATTTTSSPSKSPGSGALRQRTLLEMLDRSYATSNGSSRPAAKRACLGNKTKP